MRGRKGSTDEGGVRSPLLVRWPGHIRPQTQVTKIAGAIDLLPTLAELAGIPLKSDKPVDGLSVALLLGTLQKTDSDRMIFSHWNGKVSVRTQDHRLDATGRLYDMVNDPGQQRDLAQDRPEIASKLTRALWRIGSKHCSPTSRKMTGPFRSVSASNPVLPSLLATACRTATCDEAPTHQIVPTSPTGQVLTIESPGMSR